MNAKYRIPNARTPAAVPLYILFKKIAVKHTLRFTIHSEVNIHQEREFEKYNCFDPPLRSSTRLLFRSIHTHIIVI